jgi:hypothetical protein
MCSVGSQASFYSTAATRFVIRAMVEAEALALREEGHDCP